MPLIKCPDCGKSISLYCGKCPYCGRPIPHDVGTAYESAPDRDQPASKINRKKGSVLLIIAFIITFLYVVYSIWYWGGGGSTATNTWEQAGEGIAAAMVMPHLAATFIAGILNFVAMINGNRNLTLACAVLYAVSIFLFPVYFMFTAIQTLLAFIAFARKQ